MRTWHKLALWVLLLFSFVGSLILSADIFEFSYDLSMAIFTSILLFLLIDNILEKYSQKEEGKKLKVAIGKIIPSVKRFYEYFVDLYAGTASDKISKKDPVLKNIFYDKKRLYKLIVDNLNRTESSPYIDLERFNMQEFFSKNSLKYLTWEKAWLNQFSKLHQDLVVFQLYYGAFLSSELLFKLEDLLKIFNSLLLIEKKMQKADVNEIKINNEDNATFYEIIKLKEVMASFEAFIKCIEKEADIDLMSIKIIDINNRNTHPFLGELLK